jgi:hypothetical protein
LDAVFGDLRGLGAFDSSSPSGTSCVSDDFVLGGLFGIVEDFGILGDFDLFRAAFGDVDVLVLLLGHSFGLLLDTLGALGALGALGGGLGGSADCWSGSVVPFSFVERG